MISHEVLTLPIELQSKPPPIMKLMKLHGNKIQWFSLPYQRHVCSTLTLAMQNKEVATIGRLSPIAFQKLNILFQEHKRSF